MAPAQVAGLPLLPPVVVEPLVQATASRSRTGALVAALQEREAEFVGRRSQRVVWPQEHYSSLLPGPSEHCCPIGWNARPCLGEQPMRTR